MHRLAQINPEETQPKRTAISLVKTSALPSSQLQAVAVLMAQSQSYFSHQRITQETAEVWMSRWSELVARFGIETFQEGLSKAVHDAEWFPLPVRIERECQQIKANQTRYESARRVNEEHVKWTQHRIAHPEQYCGLREVINEATQNVATRRQEIA